LSIDAKKFYALFNEKPPPQTRPKMSHLPAPNPNREKITFEKFRILNKDTFLAPQSKLLIVEKKKKKSPNIVRTYPASHYTDAVQWYLEETKKPKKNSEYYLIVHTDEIDHEFVIAHKS
jgi:hypothetical protein